MVASLVLLYRFSAFGALLRVGHDPGNVLALRRVLQAPLLSSVAVARAVALLAALKAKGVATLAINIAVAEVLVPR